MTLTNLTTSRQNAYNAVCFGGEEKKNQHQVLETHGDAAKSVNDHIGQKHHRKRGNKGTVTVPAAAGGGAGNTYKYKKPSGAEAELEAGDYFYEITDVEADGTLIMIFLPLSGV